MLTINAGGTLTNEGGLDNNGDGTLTISEGGALNTTEGGTLTNMGELTTGAR